VITLAVSLSVLMRSMQDGVYELMIENVVGFYSGYAQVHKQGYWDEQSLDNGFLIDPKMKHLLDSTKDVSTVVPRLESFALASSGEVTKMALVVGVEPEEENQLTGLKSKLTQGEYFPRGKPSAVIGEGLGKKLRLGVGDTIVLMGQGYHGATAAGKYPIAGFVKFGAIDLNSRLVFLRLPAAQELYAAEGILTSYALNVNDSRDVSQVVKNIRKSAPIEEYEVMDWKEMMPELVQMIEADKAGGILTMAVLYLIISFIMLGTIVMMTAERQYEFGVLVAIGMKKIKLASVLFMEMVTMSIIGILSGCLLMLPVVLYVHRHPIKFGEGEMAEAYKEFGMEAVLPASTNPEIFTSQAIIVLIFAFLVFLYPFFKIMFMKPVEAMKG
jgi:ABC-type lipoprotein release transport system permease subunit